MEIGVKEDNKQKKSLISKHNPNMVNNIEIINSKESNINIEKNPKINEQLKNLKERDLEDLPDLD